MGRVVVVSPAKRGGKRPACVAVIPLGRAGGPGQCDRPATHLVDDQPLCLAHAGRRALAALEALGHD
jgi:hypothetical protein